MWLAEAAAMPKGTSLGARWIALTALAGTVLVLSCGGVSERGAPDAQAGNGAGTTSDRGGTSALEPGGTSKGGGQVQPPGNRGGAGSANPLDGFGGCIRTRTSGGDGPGACDEPARHCRDYTSSAACEAAGCIATDGTVSRLLGTGGAGGAGGAAACETLEDVFISCEEGYGGALAQSGCDASCSNCIAGGWTVGRHGRWTRDDCVWQCVDGVVRTER